MSSTVCTVYMCCVRYIVCLCDMENICYIYYINGIVWLLKDKIYDENDINGVVSLVNIVMSLSQYL